jgi:hypothetical protein
VLCFLHEKNTRYDSLLNAKLPTTDNKHSLLFAKNINNYDLDVPKLFRDGAGTCGVGEPVGPALAGKAVFLTTQMRRLPRPLPG